MQAHHLPSTVEERWAFLSPWTALLREHKIRIRTKFLNLHTYRHELDAIELELQPSVIEGSSSDTTHAKLQATAEAIELVATALSLFPDAWRALLVDQCGCQWFNPALRGQDPHELVPRFALNCGFYPGEILMAKTALRFFEVLVNSTATRTEAFTTAKHQLIAMAGVHSSSLDPVALTVDVSVWNELPETILAGHIAFVQALKTLTQSSAGLQSWCTVEAIVFDLTGPGICRDLVRRCEELASEAPFVQFAKLSIDPKELRCSQSELTQLVATLVATSPTMHLNLGDFSPDASIRGIDRTIALAMDAIAQARVCIHTLNIGQLMPRTLADSERRQAVWGHLFGTLLRPTAKCTIESLSLSSDRILHVESDAALIQSAAASTPGYKTPSRLTLGTTNGSVASLRAIITALGSDLHHLRIADSRRPTDSATVSLVLEACPNLKHLDLDDVALDSFKVFYANPHACRLSTLALTNCMLRDRPSLFEFLTQLADPQSRLGSHLSEFVLGRWGNPVVVRDRIVLSPREMAQVAQVLRRNGGIHTLQLDVGDDVPQSLVDELQLAHRQPAAVRQAPLALASKLAFLSVLANGSLNRDVVPLVFGFAATCKPRWINLIQLP